MRNPYYEIDWEGILLNMGISPSNHYEYSLGFANQLALPGDICDIIFD